MRTMLELADNASSIANTDAKARALKLGDAVAELTQRGGNADLAAPLDMKQHDGVWMFAVPVDAPRVTALRLAHLLSC